jgi:hypothetical protein
MASDMTPGHAALAGLDTVLAERPHADGHKLSAVTHDLSVFRNGLIAGGHTQRLGHVNAVISIVLATHFPLGGIPWEELEKARAWLADAVAETEPA